MEGSRASILMLVTLRIAVMDLRNGHSSASPQSQTLWSKLLCRLFVAPKGGQAAWLVKCPPPNFRSLGITADEAVAESS